MNKFLSVFSIPLLKHRTLKKCIGHYSYIRCSRDKDNDLCSEDQICSSINYLNKVVCLFQE